MNWMEPVACLLFYSNILVMCINQNKIFYYNLKKVTIIIKLF